MSDDHSGDLVVVSLHEKGFWMADLYIGMNAPPDPRDWNDAAPDDFITMSVGGQPEQCVVRARVKWPGARIEFGVADDDEDDCDETE